MRMMTSPATLSKASAMKVEVQPGKTAFGYHFHENREEIFYIVKGVGKIRTCDGDLPVKEGDFISFPTGKHGAHVISNTSDKDVLVYINFNSGDAVDIAQNPDDGTIIVCSPELGMKFLKP